MNIQIYGSRKCFDTKKAERHFKERGIPFQYVDLFKYGLSKGELRSVAAALGLANLLDAQSKEYVRLNLSRIRSNDAREEIALENPRVFRTPIVRNGKQATVGYEPETWKDWE